MAIYLASHCVTIIETVVCLVKILLTTTLQWLCCGADKANDGKLCYVQGATTRNDHKTVQLKQRGSNGVNKPFN